MESSLIVYNCVKHTTVPNRFLYIFFRYIFIRLFSIVFFARNHIQPMYSLYRSKSVRLPTEYENGFSFCFILGSNNNKKREKGVQNRNDTIEHFPDMDKIMCMCGSVSIYEMIVYMCVLRTCAFCT